jgi:hypothetical protein
MPPAAHLAGTDQLGRDTFSWLIVATRLTSPSQFRQSTSPSCLGQSSARSAAIPAAGWIAQSAVSSM